MMPITTFSAFGFMVQHLNQIHNSKYYTLHK